MKSFSHHHYLLYTLNHLFMKSKLIWLLAGCILNLTTSYAQTNSSAWLLKGNSGTNRGNFIGTTDSQLLVFKVNNHKAGYLHYDSLIGNTAFGYNSLANISLSGNFNTAIGYQALSFNYKRGFENTATGYLALYHNTKGARNTANGSQALSSNWKGQGNTAIGAHALFSNGQGHGNSAVGAWALGNSFGSANTANGVLALSSGGNGNTASGYVAAVNTVGNANTAIGFQSLLSNTSGHKNTVIGALADVTEDDLEHATAIGANAKVDASYKVRIGNHSITSIGGQVGWTSYSDERVKKDVKENVLGLAFIRELRPVTYHFSIDKEEELMGVKDIRSKAMSATKNMKIQAAGEENENDLADLDIPDDENDGAKYNIEKIQFTGFIAQEVDAVAKKLNYDFSGVDKTGKIWGLRYGDFVVPLVKAVQELSKMNDEKDAKIDDLQKQIDELKAMVTGNAKTNTILSSASLEQNSPNPFNKTTVINYTLPQKFSNALIVITDENGKTLKQVHVSGTGKGTVNVDAATLAPGVYNYSLYIDRKLIATKQMALTR